jgi:hypothetical protein
VDFLRAKRSARLAGEDTSAIDAQFAALKRREANGTVD